MKRCPRCDRTYPDSEQFCETDGTALVQGEPAFAVGGGASDSGDTVRECKVCGGKAEPGEIICNFCGARLVDDDAPAPAPRARPSVGAQRSTPAPAESPSMRFTSRMPEEQEEEEAGGGRVWSVIGYLAAAALALAAGVALALHLSARQAGLLGGRATPAAAASPAPSGPIVQLASNTPVATTGEGASAPERGQDVARKAFEDGRRALEDSYNTALGASHGLKDAMLVRLRVMPDGSVAAASVRTSTDLHPSLDVEVVKDITAWKFPAFSGAQVEIDYPLVFAPDASEVAALESALSAKLAALSPTEEPEYASATAAAPAASAAAAPSTVAAVTTPAVAAPLATPKPVVRRRIPRRELAAIPKPTPPLLDRVQEALRGNRKLGRVKAYTDRGTVTLFGKVYNDNDKALAEKVVRGVPGVTGVNDTITTDVAEWADTAQRITAQLQSAGLDKVTVRVIGRDAYLDGEVKTQLERERAVTIVESAAPVTVRANLIRVATGSILGF
jgi:BON domain